MVIAFSTFRRVGDVLLSILPCWHIFERAAEYCFLARGATLTYSSIKTLKADLQVNMSLFQFFFLNFIPGLISYMHLPEHCFR